MAASTVIKDLYDGNMTLRDGTGSPVSLVVPFSVGNLVISNLKAAMRATNKYETRGVLNSARKGARIYATGSFSCQVADFFDGTARTVLEFLAQLGASSGNTSTLSNGDVYCLDLIWDVEGTDLGDASDHQLVLEECDCTFDIQEGEPIMLNVNFEVLGAWSGT